MSVFACSSQDCVCLVPNKDNVVNIVSHVYAWSYAANAGIFIKTHLQIDSISGCLTLVVYMYLGNKEAFVGAQKSDSVGEIYPSAACACFWI